MRKIIIICLVLILYNGITAQKLDTIHVSQFRSTQIIFDEPIELVEAGTGDLQVKNKIVDNILIIQSIVPEEDFIKTNLFIKTKSNVYNPSLSFNATPKKATYVEQNFASAIGKNVTAAANTSVRQNPTSDIKSEEIKGKKETNDLDAFGYPKYTADEKNLIQSISNRKDVFKPSRDYTTGVFFRFNAHYLNGGKVYYKFEIENESSLNYNIKDFYFTVRNKKSRNSSKTEKDLDITKNLTNIKTVNGKTKRFLIFEFNPFSIGKDEEMIVNIKEEDGSRDLTTGIPYFIVNNPIKL